MHSKFLESKKSLATELVSKLGKYFKYVSILGTDVDNKIVKGGVPIQLRAFTAILFGIILIVMIVMNIKGSGIANKLRLIKKETKQND